MGGAVGLAITGVTTVAVLLFAVPLAVAVSRLYRTEAVAELAREAERGLSVLPAATGGAPIRLPTPVDPSVTLGLYDAAGRRVAGTGPQLDRDLVTAALRGRQVDLVTAGRLVVALPVPLSEDTEPTVLRASAPAQRVTTRVREAWLLMAGLALGVLAVAATLAARQAARVVAPLRALTESARRLGRGDFSVRAVPTGLEEIDDVGTALEATARRLGAMVERERAFAADASHQIRTPLAGLRLRLEGALLDPASDPRLAIERALPALDRVESTVDDLLELRRDVGDPAEPLDLARALSDATAEWGPRLALEGRSLVVEVAPALPVGVARVAAVRQVLDVLLDNAHRHGAGR